MQHLPTHPFLLHPRTGAPLAAVGHRRNGEPIWPIMGGDGTEDDANLDVGDEDEDDEGDSGDKLAPEDDPNSIEYWKKRSRQNEREAKRAKRERDAALAKPDDKSDEDKVDPDKIREQAKAEAAAELLKGRVEDKIEAKARAFADPEDAVAVLLRSHDIEDFIDDGKVDVDAITDALEELSTKKPHLLAQGKRFQGGVDGGARKETPKRAGSLQEAITKSYESR